MKHLTRQQGLRAHSDCLRSSSLGLALGLASLLAARPAMAQVTSPSRVILADGPKRTYAPPEEIAGNGGQPLSQQFLTTFTPPSPVGGVLIYVHCGGYSNLEPLDVIDLDQTPGRRWLVDLYDAGWTIVTPGLTGVRIGTSQGIFSDYGSARFLSFTGESWWERDMVLVVQKVHQMIDDGELAGEHHLVGGFGQSASSIALANIAFGPVESYWSSGSPQLLQPALLSFVVADSIVSWFPGFDGDQWGAPIKLGAHFEGSVPGLPPPYPYGLDLVPAEHLEAASPVKRLEDRARAYGRALPPPPMYLFATEPPSVLPQGWFDGSGLPVMRNAIAGPLVQPPTKAGQLHDYWFSWIVKRHYDMYWSDWARFNRLATLPGFAYPAPNADQDFVYPGALSDEFQDDLRDWVMRRLTGKQNPDWTSGPVGRSIGSAGMRSPGKS